MFGRKMRHRELGYFVINQWLHFTAYRWRRCVLAICLRSIDGGDLPRRILAFVRPGRCLRELSFNPFSEAWI